LGEIESRLAKHHAVNEVVITVGGKEDVDKYICAYIVSTQPPGVTELRNYLSKQIPEYMIPAYFITLEKLPLTPNGKIDRKAFPEPGGERPETVAAYKPPQSANEKAIAEAWLEILKIDKVGIDDNFFELGGNSLKIIQLNTKLKEKLKKEIPVVSMFTYPTIRTFTQYALQEDEKAEFLNETQEGAETMLKGKQRLKRQKKRRSREETFD
ncbi:MAG: non-ribosomal peptide synthetase, partial [bacterium]|nr:non-ribosomal peptide synthetase [bacterium]